MSLNGLDTPEVQEAHQTAIAEPGGWFLLKYNSRDSVELHGRGKGGVHEARLAIAKYEEPSPLYGLLIYRRRKVLIKYIPVGTSRVLQARTAVHFQDVAERYSPYETLLEITTAEGLNDTSLAASFPLHTASISTSSSRLHEISEDAEDSGAAPRRLAVQNAGSGSIFGTRQYKMEKRVDQIMRPDRAPPTIHITTGDSNNSIASSTLSPGKTSISSQILVREDSGKRSITSLSSPLSDSMTSYGSAASEASAKRENDSRSSLASEAVKQWTPTQTTTSSVETAPSVEPLLQESNLPAPEKSTIPPTNRDVSTDSPSERVNKTLEEPFDFSYLDAKPKIKLAPRPVASKRVTTSAVSALPAAYRQQTKQQVASPTSPASVASFSLPAPPIPASAEYNPRPLSRGSVKSFSSHKSTTMTPDKVRLMKAVELRKRQLRKSNPQLPSSIPGVAPEVPRIPEQIFEQPKQEAKETRLEELQHAGVEEEMLAKKADSGIEMDYQKRESKLEDVSAGAAIEPKQVQAPCADDAGIEMDYQKRESKLEDVTAGAAAEPKRVQEPSADDAVTVEALKNDEAKAEAEGYGAVPEEIKTDTRPNLPSYGSPRDQDSHKTDHTPSSKYSDAADYPEPVVQAVQEATRALSISTADDKSKKDVPTIVMSPGTPLQPKSAADLVGSWQAKQTDDDNDDEQNDNLAAQQTPTRRNNSDLAKRRRGIVEPLNLEAQAELLSDDELMDELQEAVVHQAMPVQVARSPVNEYFRRRPSNISLVSAQSQQTDHSASARVVANREKAVDELEKDDSLSEPNQIRRSVSPMNSIDAYTGLRRNVSTGISKRFQALTEGQRDSVGALPNVSPPQSQDGSPNDRRLRSPPRSRPSSFRRWGLGDRANSSSTIASTADNAPVWNVTQDSNGKRDSIHVRARIVRPPSGLDTHDEKPDSEEAAQLQESKLEVNHSMGRPQPPPLNTDFAFAEPRSATSPTRGRNGSATPMTAHPEDFPAPPSSRTVTSPMTDDGSITPSTRTSRFFKRMSSLGGPKRRSAIAPSILSAQNLLESNASVKSLRTTSPITEKDRSDMPPAAALGDLNFQFPDSLLWKRRWLTLDEAGNLVLGIPQTTEHQPTAQTKKLHLSEFKTPYMPDLDRQEMPHSVCLDFTEGGTLQIACEDAMAQRHVLNLLRSYWKSWVG